MTKRERKDMDSKLGLLMDHYSKSIEDMDTRRTRKNGWNDIVNAYMGVLPKNWPYTTLVTDPRIRTTVLEKTARLLNAKLQGRLIPREGGDIIGARIQNSLLEYQWDAATNGGSMIEKVALSDQITRLFGAAFAYVYWDNVKECNEIKVCDARDVFIDFGSSHIRNAKWVQYREFSTLEQLAEQGYDIEKFKKEFSLKDNDDLASVQRDTKYESIFKQNRGLSDKTGLDESNPIVEVITEWTDKTRTIFFPEYGFILDESENPYDHGKIPFAMLRYYPLGDDIYGESEVESVLPLQRAINAILCGFIDEMNLSMRPPVKIANAPGLRIETIEYGPGARWIVGDINQVQEASIGGQAVANFNSTYPAMVAAYNTAMGDQSLGVSNVRGENTKKTATEVMSLEKQQNSRDQYNQVYLSEFLKDIMMMWLSNNKQYLFDNPSKQYHLLKIVGKDKIQGLTQLGLSDKDVPDEVMKEVEATIQADPNSVSDENIRQLMLDTAVPKNPIVTNAEEGMDPEDYEIVPKLNPSEQGEEAELYIEKSDFEGVYDYIPDVKAMSAGAGVMQQQARQEFLQTVLNPQVVQMLQMQGETIKIKEVLVSSAEDAGFKDAEALFQPVQNGSINQTGPGAIQAGAMPGGAIQGAGIPEVSQALPTEPSPVGIPTTQGL